MKNLENVIIENISKVTNRIKKVNNKNSDIKLVAVSKTKNIEHIKIAYHNGIRYFAENYIQEAIDKIDLARNEGLSDIEWHFIGHLQSNKAKLAVQYFDVLQSLNSIKLADKLNKYAKDLDKILKVFIQIKSTSNDSTKVGGIDIERIDELAEYVVNQCSNLQFDGIMVIPDKNEISSFNKANIIFNNLKKYNISTLSMGMSDSLEIAIEKGSNMVRIGSDIFGNR